MSKRKRLHPHVHLVRLSQVEPVVGPQLVVWPGVSDASLSAPDQVKFDLAQFVSTQEPGRTKLKSLEDALAKGPLGHLPEIGHWAMEEFFWHGLPGDDWNPIEAFLTAAGERFPEPAGDQLRRWQEARIGLYEVGEVAEGSMGLQEWDAVTGAHIGPPVRAIARNIGGVKTYRRLRGQITLTTSHRGRQRRISFAPWAMA